MSHFTDVKVEIKDLAALEEALRNMGFRMLHETTCRGYTNEEMQNVIKLPGEYDCGVISTESGYALRYDSYNGHVEKYIGEKGTILLQKYTKVKIEQDAKRLGFKCIMKGDVMVVYNPKNAQEKVEVTFNSDGTAKIHAKGFKGKGCMVFADLEKALGTVVNHQKTSEYGAGDNVTSRELLMQGF